VLDKCDLPFCKGEGGQRIGLRYPSGKTLDVHYSCYFRQEEIRHKIFRYLRGPCEQKLRWRRTFPMLRYYWWRHIERHGCQKPVSPELRDLVKKALGMGRI